MINEGSIFTIQYSHNSFTQTKKMLSMAKVEAIRANATYARTLDDKERKAYEKTHPISFERGEVTPDSPLGKVVMGKEVGDVCEVELLEHMGGAFKLKILEIN